MLANLNFAQLKTGQILDTLADYIQNESLKDKFTHHYSEFLKTQFKQES